MLGRPKKVKLEKLIKDFNKTQKVISGLNSGAFNSCTALSDDVIKNLELDKQIIKQKIDKILLKNS
jgi:hypothetical protein